MTRLAIIFSLLFATPAWADDKICYAELDHTQKWTWERLQKTIKADDCDMINVEFRNDIPLHRRLGGAHVLYITQLCRFDRQIVTGTETVQKIAGTTIGTVIKFSCVLKK